MVKRFKLWNRWRKNSLNNWTHKLLVLFGLVESPTFALFCSIENAE